MNESHERMPLWAPALIMLLAAVVAAPALAEAAALAVKRGVTPRRLPVAELQQALRQAGFPFTDAPCPRGKGGRS